MEGASHNVTALPVDVGDGERYVPDPSSHDFSDSQNYTFNYKLQYFMEVESPWGTCEGSGWYDEGSMASISVAPATVSLEGLIGIFGGARAFESWNGDAAMKSPTFEIKVDGPKKFLATWKNEYANLYLRIIIVGGVVGVSIFLVRKKRSRVAYGGYECVCTYCGARNDVNVKECRQCGHTITDDTRIYDKTKRK